MPDPVGHPESAAIRRVAMRALYGGLALLLLKLLAYAITNSAAALSDALESIINLVAAAVAIYSVWLANRPADRDHPYGHGKIEFLAAGMEGWMILVAGAMIAYEAVKRLTFGPEPIQHLNVGAWLLGGVSLLSLVLALYVYRMGRKYDSLTLVADGKHLLTDVVSTVGVTGGLIAAHWTGYDWIDPVTALVMAAVVLWTSWRLLWQSSAGLMDRIDVEDEARICAVLDRYVAEGVITGYHKVRHRHNGPFHWVDMHIQMNGSMSVRESHGIASRIENEIEKLLGQANATAHVEPAEANRDFVLAPKDSA